MSVIDEVKDRVDLVALIGQQVALKKTGKNYRGCCPFHQEKTPSFYVYPDDWSYHCFGCGAHGNGFDYVMAVQQLSFGEALRELAARAGVVLPARPVDEQAERTRERLRQAGAAAATFYHHLLLHSSAGTAARTYVEQRGVSREAVDHFQLGYSLAEWQALVDHLVARGFSADELVAAGLAGRREDGSLYDRFRGRLMFPIHDREGRVIAFGSRALDGSNPKYLNSPDTPLFEKSAVLYGIHHARPEIRSLDRAVLVEGYFDVLIAHQHGCRNVVGVMGSALSEAQLHLLKRLTKHLVLALDPDEAGDEATRRGLERAGEVYGHTVVPVPTPRGLIRYAHTLDVDLRIAELPRGRDPDEIIRDDALVWKTLVNDARPVVDFLFVWTAARLKGDDPKSKSAMAERLLAAIREVPDRVAQAHYVQKLADLLGIRAEVLFEVLRRRTQRAGESPAEAPHASGQTDSGGKKEAGVPLQAGEGTVLEEYCLALLLAGDGREDVWPILSADHFRDPGARQIFLVLAGGLRGAALRERLDAVLHERLDLLQTLWPPADEPQRGVALRKCAAGLVERHLRLESNRLGVQADEARRAGDRDAEARLLARMKELNDRIGDVKRELRGQLGATPREKGVRR